MTRLIYLFVLLAGVFPVRAQEYLLVKFQIFDENSDKKIENATTYIINNKNIVDHSVYYNYCYCLAFKETTIDSAYLKVRLWREELSVFDTTMNIILLKDITTFKINKLSTCRLKLLEYRYLTKKQYKKYSNKAGLITPRKGGPILLKDVN